MRMNLSFFNMQALLSSSSVFNLVAFFFPVVFGKAQYLQTCNDIFPPAPGTNTQDNCTLSCSLRFQHFVSTMRLGEVALCLTDGMKPLTCKKDEECRRHHDDSYCRRAYCLCAAETGLRGFYVFLGGSLDTYTDVCVTSYRWQGRRLPFMAFPWKTLLIVFGTLMLIGLFVMAVRWFSPLFRVWLEDHQRRLGREAVYSTQTDMNNQRFHNGFLPTTQNRGTNLQGQHRASGVQYWTQNGTTPHTAGRQCQHCPFFHEALQGDKPPPYETAVQLMDPPPSYAEAEGTEQPTSDESHSNPSTPGNSNGSASVDTIQTRPTHSLQQTATVRSEAITTFPLGETAIVQSNSTGSTS